ncbi:MAG TPA: Glu/Leu/Phe/Val dehydrogenase dimerization domain-containing protein [Baekduia sp.]|uniref:Glu/Leu/Phe/Val dehydrogenase family protein n=1 Tax=Baekduia sp. TaxID=2600305 RepID=UPI002D797E29|nr:Glu/Leu/Phe/Val dehydrogenase dimerization domain-containing protein [Baekduia sp.]HET6509681.1 Glu/Leu/Phe/Val dehydrogenase dimerization domain-containing protein [Baekduia sp.]
MSSDTGLQHERVVVERGRASGLPIIIAVHSTKLGAAVGGCRLWSYPDWRDGLADALALSSAMSLKCAAAGIDHGGGKTVIALPPGAELSPARRVAVMEDLGDAVERLGGQYYVGEDVGTGPEDIQVVRGRTRWTSRPRVERGAGGPEPTAVGVLEAIRATARHAFGSGDLSGRRFAVVGLGHVGLPLAHMLAAEGAVLVVSDIDARKRAVADELGARWLAPAEASFAQVDVLVPAALGGVVSAETIDRLRCAAIVGPANNQLVDERWADELQARGITWAPDFVVNAGGVVFEVGVTLDDLPEDTAMARVREIGARLDGVFARAADTGKTPLVVALDDAREALATAAVVR